MLNIVINQFTLQVFSNAPTSREKINTNKLSWSTLEVWQSQEVHLGFKMIIPMTLQRSKSLAQEWKTAR